jgi:hypothetical protein
MINYATTLTKALACGLPLTYEGFDPSTLVYWWRRLGSSDRPYRIKDAIDAFIEATGVLKGKSGGCSIPRFWPTRWPPRTR